MSDEETCKKREGWKFKVTIEIEDRDGGTVYVTRDGGWNADQSRGCDQALDGTVTAAARAARRTIPDEIRRTHD